MRNNAPVYWDSTNELWGISRHEDIATIEKAGDRFISSDQVKGGYRPNIPADASMIGLDDPFHHRRRMLVARRFTPRAVATKTERVRALVTRLLDSVADRGRAEIVRDLAAPLPAMMIGELLGFPNDAWPRLQDWSERTIMLGGGPRYHTDDGMQAAWEFAQASAELYADKQRCPADDVMSVWVNAEIPSKPFGLPQVVSDSLLLLDGGAETTRTVIARTILNLIRFSDQYERLRDGGDFALAVEEFIRYVTPVHNMCRVTTEDTELHGVTIPKGHQVVLMYSSANRDPRVFHDPERFDVTRTPNPHLAFGFGTHFCLGAALARLEIRVFFEEWLRRFRNVRIVPGTEVVETPNPFVYGVQSAHVEFDVVP